MIVRLAFALVHNPDQHIDIDAADHGQMADQDLTGLRQRLLWAERAIRPDFEDQLVVVGALTHTRPLDFKVHAAHRAKNRIDR